MSLYRLSPFALDDIDDLLYDIAERSGWDRSMDMEEKLFAALDRLGRSPGVGHLRDDLIPHEIYFDYARPYLILYRIAAMFVRFTYLRSFMAHEI